MQMRTRALFVLAALLLSSTACNSVANETTAAPSPRASATAETVTVYGELTDYVVDVTGQEERDDGIVVTTEEWSATIDFSDPRASGVFEFLITSNLTDHSVGGVWTAADVTIANDDGTWVGFGEGVYTFATNVSDAQKVDGDEAIIGVFHLEGTGAYEGLRLDFYVSEAGEIGTINPVG